MSSDNDKKPLVLVVDDEPKVRRLLRASLEMSDYEVVEAATGAEGVQQAVLCQPDIMLLELGLPDMDGNAVLKRFREWSQAPVMVVSDRHRDEDKITALDCGANDYVTKPFSTGELLARLRVIRRYMPPSSRPEVFRSGNLTVDTAARVVKVRGQKIKLSSTEYALLLLFVKNAGRVLTHGDILRQVWGTDDDARISILRVYIGYLREKIEAEPAIPELLLTEPGIGYRLAVSE